MGQLLRETQLFHLLGILIERFYEETSGDQLKALNVFLYFMKRDSTCELILLAAISRLSPEQRALLHSRISTAPEDMERDLATKKAGHEARRNPSIKVSLEISEKVEPTPKVDPVPVATLSSDTVEASTKPAEVEAVAEVAPQSPQQQSATEEKAVLRPTGSAKSVSELISLFETPAKARRGASRAEGKPQGRV